MANITFQNVSKLFNKTQKVVSEITLEINNGEFFVIIGPSGCGKTTLLRMVAGLEEITGGTIKINDKIINNISPGRRDVSMVFQNYALFPHMTVYDNVAFGLKIRKTPKKLIEKKVMHTCSILGLDSHLKKKPNELSGGQRQRVALGRAIVREPHVFLFDEPLSNLDAKLRTEMRAELLVLHKKLKATIIYVTHDQVEAMTLGDRICVIKEGKLQQLGTPNAIYKRPENKFVASFFGSPSMNLFNAQLKCHLNQFSLKISEDTIISLSRESYNYDNLKKNLDKNIFAGIRPGALNIINNGIHPDSLPVRVDLVELIGDEKYIHCHTRGIDKIVAILPESVKLKLGDKINLFIEPDSLHLFDEQGERI
ncbi:MAG: sn-glycerol-3-phosphate ABC transporter ATP-binding protein UgpC [bacterium]